jgi:hypothetical protein
LTVSPLILDDWRGTGSPGNPLKPLAIISDIHNMDPIEVP